MKRLIIGDLMKTKTRTTDDTLLDTRLQRDSSKLWSNFVLSINFLGKETNGPSFLELIPK